MEPCRTPERILGDELFVPVNFNLCFCFVKYERNSFKEGISSLYAWRLANNDSLERIVIRHHVPREIFFTFQSMPVAETDIEGVL